jgi:hypothetical protein
MKRLLLIAALLSTFMLRSFGADATIANAPGGAITTVPDTYRMPWENPGVQGYYITFLNLSNQILSGYAPLTEANITNLMAGHTVPINISGYSLTSSNVWAEDISGTALIGTLIPNAAVDGQALGISGSYAVGTNYLPGVSIGGSAGSATNLVSGIHDLSTDTNIWKGLTIFSNNVIIAQTNNNMGLFVTNGTKYVALTNGDIKASGRGTFENVLVNGTLDGGAFAAGSSARIAWSSRSRMYSPVNGSITMCDDAGITNVTLSISNVMALGTLTAANGLSSDGVRFIKPPTNAPTDGQVIKATSTGGATAWGAAGAGDAVLANSQTFTGTNTFTQTIQGTTTNALNLASTGTITAAQLNVGTLVITNAPVLDLGASTNYPATNLINRAVFVTNAYDPVVLNATRAHQSIATNANLTISGFSGLVSGAGHVLSVKYLNNGGSPITVTGPPTCYYHGTASTNAMAIAAGKRGVWSFWILPNVETNCCNISQQ